MRTGRRSWIPEPGRAVRDTRTRPAGLRRHDTGESRIGLPALADAASPDNPQRSRTAPTCSVRGTSVILGLCNVLNVARDSQRSERRAVDRGGPRRRPDVRRRRSGNWVRARSRRPGALRLVHRSRFFDVDGLRADYLTPGSTFGPHTVSMCSLVECRCVAAVIAAAWWWSSCTRSMAAARIASAFEDAGLRDIPRLTRTPAVAVKPLLRVQLRWRHTSQGGGRCASGRL